MFAQVYSTYAQYCVWVNIKGKIRKQNQSIESHSGKDNETSNPDTDMQIVNLEADSQHASNECNIPIEQKA